MFSYKSLSLSIVSIVSIVPGSRAADVDVRGAEGGEKMPLHGSEIGILILCTENSRSAAVRLHAVPAPGVVPGSSPIRSV